MAALVQRCALALSVLNPVPTPDGMGTFVLGGTEVGGRWWREGVFLGKGSMEWGRIGTGKGVGSVAAMHTKS